MTWTVSRDALLTALAEVGGAIDTKPTLATLGYVLVSGGIDGLTLKATNLEMQITTLCACEGMADGIDVLLPHAKLKHWLRFLPDAATVTLDLEKDACVARSGRSRQKLATLPPDSYPVFSNGSGEVAKATLSADLLGRALTQTGYAMGKQDVRYYLNGVFIRLDGKTIRVAGSDGHRCALWDLPFATDAKRQMIVPRRVVQALVKRLTDGDVVLRMTPDILAVEIGRTTVHAKLIEGRYPDLDRVMPTEVMASVGFGRTELAGAIERNAGSSGEYRSIGVELAAGLLSLEATNTTGDTARDELEVEYDGETHAFGVNADYMGEALRIMRGDRVQIDLSHLAAHLLMSEPVEGIEGGTARHLVMPVRL